MRITGTLVLFNLALVTGLLVPAWRHAPESNRANPAGLPIVAAPATAAVERTEPGPARLPGRERKVPSVVAPAPASSAPLARHELLAARADAGESDAALELAGLLEDCASRDETRALMQIIISDTGHAPNCEDTQSCAAVERLYDEFERSLQRWADADGACRVVPRSWIDSRGRWLQRAAELGDAEAMACYALVGVEMAPSSFHGAWAPWMQHWREHALAWAWEAWDKGEPRAALALARLYGPVVNLRDSGGVGEPDPDLSFRFSLLLTRALDLNPSDSDLAANVDSASDQLAPSAFADEQAWVEQRLPALRKRLALPSRTPDDCWQNFAMFENRSPAAYDAMR